MSLKTFLSIRPSRRIAIFVHGYGGDPVSTWADFNRLAPEEPALQGYDLIFYDYDGLQAELRASVGLFYNFLTWLFNSSIASINESLPPYAMRPSEFKYDEAVLICHSLGAVIARSAILRATREKKRWVTGLKLVLFAPAHKGARVVKLALEVNTHFRFLYLFSNLARFKSPLIDQLEEGSKELIELESGTLEALSSDSNKHLIAKKVCLAELEHIVSNEKFAADPEGDPIRRATHKSVCKPRQPSFLKPLQAVLEGISD